VTRPTPTGAVERSLAAIAADDRTGIWISVVDEREARAQAAAVEARLAAGEVLPLAGFTLAVKDNIDVAGLPTTAGCPAYAYRPTESAPVVGALQRAGAVVLGKTNLDQFATGLVGTRSPFGPCPNAHWPSLVSGGSSSGSAVAVAAGHVDLALGTDTAGSGRVPAAANGIVGIKPTRGAIPTTGVVPACPSLDCVSVFAVDVATAALAARVAAGAEPGLAVLGEPGPPRLAVPRPDDLHFDGDPSAAARFDAAVQELVAVTGAKVVEVDLRPFLDAGRLLYEGAFVAERYAAVGAFVDEHPGDVDPVVGPIIAAAGHLPAWQLFADLERLRELGDEAAATWITADVLVVPSVPRLPTVAEVVAEPLATNSMLGTYTNFVNLLDLAAVTLPVGPAGTARPPTSLTLIGQAGSDELLAGLAGRIA
jgi:allophanate hydrolase